MATVASKPITADEFYEFVHRPENRDRHFELDRLPRFGGRLAFRVRHLPCVVRLRTGGEQLAGPWTYS